MSRFRANGSAGQGTSGCTDSFYVESRDCGRIIGKGGTTIQELQRSTGTRIKVCRDKNQDRMQKEDYWSKEAQVKVEIWGTRAAAMDARQRIKELLQEGVNRSDRRNKTASRDETDWSDRRRQNNTDRSYHSDGKTAYWDDTDWPDERQQNDTASWDDTDQPDKRQQQDTDRSYHNDGKTAYWDDTDWPDERQQNDTASWDYSGSSGGNINSHDDEEWSARAGGRQKAANNIEYDDDHHHVNPADEEEVDSEEKRRQYDTSCDWIESSPVASDRQPEPVRCDGGLHRQRRRQNERRYSPDRRSENTDFRGSRNYTSSYQENSVMSNFGYAPEGKDDFPKTIIYVHQGDIGHVIGKGGFRIKYLQNDCDCVIEMGKAGKDSMVPLYLIGPPDKIDKVKRRLQKFVEYVEGEEILPKPMPAEKDLAPVVKNFYQEQEHIRNMSPEDVARFRLENNNIMVEYPEFPDEKLPNPVVTFRDCFAKYPDIMSQIRKQGFSDPTPIQVQAWPIIMSGYDLIGIAQTGTGKTLAFLLPAMIHIDGQPTPRKERRGPTMLVLCPTRELALQIEEEVNKISYKGIRSVCIYGGVSKKEQMIAVRKGVEIIVATPGRLLELISYGFINLCDVSYLVLDEADRMLDMGFREDIRGICLKVRRDRQTIMTSATWPEDVQLMARIYLRKPVQVHVGSMDLSAVHTVKQEMYFLRPSEKLRRLREYLQDMGPDDKAIVFVARKTGVDELCCDLSDHGIHFDSIHGGRDQDDRISSLNDFKNGLSKVLVATDVASRGLDVKDITIVINYDFPNSMEDYVHRIGRTGRAGRSGKAITFLTKADVRYTFLLMKILKEADQEIPKDLHTMAALYEDDSFQEKQSHRRPGGRGNWRRDRF